jgi:hypothetical protein
MCIKCLNMNETVACCKVFNSIDLVLINKLVKYVFCVICKWENKLNRAHLYVEAVEGAG